MTSHTASNFVSRAESFPSGRDGKGNRLPETNRSAEPSDRFRRALTIPPAAVYPAIGRIVCEDPALNELIDPAAPIEVLASGFEWSEGPIWDRSAGHLLFSDIPRNSIMKWKEGEGLSLFMRPSGYTGVVDYGREPGSNGLTMDTAGRLHACEHGDRRVTRLEADGGKWTLADSYEGKRLNSPNDLVFKSNGDLYFTDPPYGLPNRADDPRKELTFCGVYRVKPDRSISLLTAELKLPNGLAFSPDESILYVAQSAPDAAIWMAYPVNDDGTLGVGRIFADVTHLVGTLRGLPDGLKIDQAGNLWATGPGGVHVITPEGRFLGRIDTGQSTANCAWGDDGSVLYITADSYLCRVQTRTKGNGW